jgi:hypothetical protein
MDKELIREAQLEKRLLCSRSSYHLATGSFATSDNDYQKLESVVSMVALDQS